MLDPYSQSYLLQPQEQWPPQQQSLPQPQAQPSPPSYVKFKYWDQALREFLTEMGLMQALRGFENDMLVLNSDWEEERVSGAMARFVRNIVSMDLGKKKEIDDASDQADPTMRSDNPLEERKLAYVQLANGAKPQSQTSINKSISQFLVRNRARVNMSNRSEFLFTLDEIRASATSIQPDLDTPSWATCARTDMKPVDRETQMKYDIAKNEDGPLKRTVKGADAVNADQKTERKHETVSVGARDDVAMSLVSEKYPALDERLGNLEKHLAVRYVPMPPRSLLHRLKFIEDHMIQLEKDYPPWAALHFNQPHRGWPPPPRSTPIIVPPHMRSPATNMTTASSLPNAASSSGTMADTGERGSKMRNSTSSLHKAVLEKLEVYQAMNDLAGGSGSGTRS
ncbi:hypothetical protein AX17_003268 [Amanita inopinata Kibby_2008]|nr:hypothetical protein AX17_003268 [Amanita inopinata Kibby_2008]